ncbi:S41 family peptidase [Winogradskyella sp. UBA3174]|uniref:S41 family peptidase n=1 Tax=Winogradskyella sp. UBA3174 TaxID=1947785 RepID=UPI0025F74E32|nr:S41 family peptidase [Winogradskyella sp. UBA3174]|tara:strand:+ start:66287 stop:69580 length:3294 start_codon:yes stop_codon:yes gene_type:complete
MKNFIKKNHFTICFFILFLFSSLISFAQGTRLLRQPDISATHITYAYGSDLWVSELNSQEAKRITSTAASESNPYFSPDGNWIAFSSNRAGRNNVYIVSKNGGEPKRLTWHPSGSTVRGWTNDGKHILFASDRDTAPRPYNRLYTISIEGGAPTLLTKQWSHDGSYSPNGKQMIVDKMDRWDIEWRAYRGGQNTPLIILDLESQNEVLLPHENTTDIQPMWLRDKIYFLSDRDLVANIWSFNPASKVLEQITKFKGSDIKWLNGHNDTLTYERDGFLHTITISTGKSTQLNINVVGDFPWTETKWEDVSNSTRSASLSPNGKRAIMQSRGDIFTVPVEFGDSRNITETSGTADRRPIWSPKGDRIAWFSDADRKGYALMLSSQDGLSEPEAISIGKSKLGWSPSWSPDGKHIAFVDDDVRLRYVNLETKKVKTFDIGGNNLERGSIELKWSPDSKWIAYEKSASNNFRQIYIYSIEKDISKPLTDPFADSFSPAWDLNKKQLYFLASTEVALGSGWANTSSMTADPSYSAYVVNLDANDDSPFKPKSDEEDVKEDVKEEEEEEDEEKNDDKKEDKDSKEKKEDKAETMHIDFEGIGRRTLALPMPSRNYGYIIAGPKGSIFISEYTPNGRGATLHKFSLEDQESKEFTSGANSVSVTSNGKHMLARLNGSWKVIKTSGPNAKGAKGLKVNLQMKLDRSAEWEQMFEEAWRYERDYFYDPNMHGRDWKVVYKRYAPLVPFIKHRADLTYILDQVNGELSVGHSFVRGGDYPDVERTITGLLGADITPNDGHWQIERIYTTENWNPGLTGPLDAPGLNIKEGYYIVGINGNKVKADENFYKYLDGTSGKQTILHINDKPEFKGHWTEIVEPIRSENSIRQRTWVEDNRKLVDKLSNGRLGYIWVPNTGGPGFVSFNRYYFAQQDKEGAVIDERFNGGGLLDDYMVDLMTRSLRAGLTNEVPNGKPMKLPAGILGPKVLLINELAGSGGDFFPWVFRQQNAGKLIGMTTWGGLVKSSTHYALIDGGSLTAPDNAVFDPINNKWIAENIGVAPDIKVRQDAKALSNGTDPQLERAVEELMKQLGIKKEIKKPKFLQPAKGN